MIQFLFLTIFVLNCTILLILFQKETFLIQYTQHFKARLTKVAFGAPVGLGPLMFK